MDIYIYFTNSNFLLSLENKLNIKTGIINCPITLCNKEFHKKIKDISFYRYTSKNGFKILDKFSKALRLIKESKKYETYIYTKFKSILHLCTFKTPI
jgi:hypothetical protein